MVPKFRAWDERYKKYIDGVLIDCNGKVYFDDDVATQDDLDISVEQSTGMKDANGNMIYENDIIKYFGASERVKIKTTYGIVFYDSDHGCFNSRIQNEEHNKGGISP